MCIPETQLGKYAIRSTIIHHCPNVQGFVIVQKYYFSIFICRWAIVGIVLEKISGRHGICPFGFIQHTINHGSLPDTKSFRLLFYLLPGKVLRKTKYCQ